MCDTPRFNIHLQRIADIPPIPQHFPSCKYLNLQMHALTKPQVLTCCCQNQNYHIAKAMTKELKPRG